MKGVIVRFKTAPDRARLRNHNLVKVIRVAVRVEVDIAIAFSTLPRGFEYKALLLRMSAVVKDLTKASLPLAPLL